MTEKTSEYRVEVTGPEKAREQFLSALKDLQGEGERSGIEIEIERIETTDLEGNFERASEK